ncbi:MAG: electron transport complex subunit RsxC [Oscillospiraceae bacterium]
MAIFKSKKFLPGAKVSHRKNTNDKVTVNFVTPSFVTIPMIQHMGVPCEPLVKKGDQVFVGQKIGESSEFFSVPIHASCSGIVESVLDYHTVSGNSCKAIVIACDSLQTVDKNCKRPLINSKEDFINAIKESGLVGLGGAGFPTFIKLDYKDIDTVTKLVINAAECEPYITADNRECLENTANIVTGIRAVKKYLNIDEVFIGLEDNKPKAIELLNSAFNADDNVKVVRLKTIYPQGAEKSIIYATTGVVVKEGKLPADCGVIVLNISTVGFIGGYLENGIPLVSKRITVDGDFVTKPDNLKVPIGTPVSSVLDYCQIEADKCGKILMGGPMMGIPVSEVSAPIIKNNNAIIVLSKKASTPPVTTACIRCQKCVGHCPMNLMPRNLEKAYDTEDVELLNELRLSLCINCGCCTYICPAKRHLAQKNQLAKLLVRNKNKSKGV